MHDIKLTQGVNRATIRNQLTMMNKNIKRIGNQPGRMLASATDRRNENLNLLAGVVVQHRADVQEPPIASLSPIMPRNQYELWREYTHGIVGGRKAAENFRIKRRDESRINTIVGMSFGKSLKIAWWLRLDSCWLPKQQLTAFTLCMECRQVSQRL